MANEINFYRGLQENLPTDLNENIIYNTSDTHRLYVGKEIIGENISKLTIGGGVTSEGLNTNSGKWSLVGGKESIVSGKYSLCYGRSCLAEADYSFAVNQNNIVRASDSAVFGHSNTIYAAAQQSFLCGGSNWTSARNTFICGISNAALEDAQYSSILGYHLVSAKAYQLITGHWNNYKTNTIFEVGNGSGEDARSNAFEVLTDGQAYVYGTPTNTYSVIRKKELDTLQGEVDALRAEIPDMVLSTMNSGTVKYVPGKIAMYDKTNSKTACAATGTASAAFGDGTAATRYAQTVVGRFNDSSNDGASLLVVGNGTSSTAKSNAFIVWGDGRASVATAPKNPIDVVRKIDLDEKFPDQALPADPSVITYSPIDGFAPVFTQVSPLPFGSTIVQRDTDGSIIAVDPTSNAGETLVGISSIKGQTQTLVNAYNILATNNINYDVTWSEWNSAASQYQHTESYSSATCYSSSYSSLMQFSKKALYRIQVIAKTTSSLSGNFTISYELYNVDTEELIWDELGELSFYSTNTATSAWRCIAELEEENFNESLRLNITVADGSLIEGLTVIIEACGISGIPLENKYISIGNSKNVLSKLTITPVTLHINTSDFCGSLDISHIHSIYETLDTGYKKTVAYIDGKPIYIYSSVNSAKLRIHQIDLNGLTAEDIYLASIDILDKSSS